jgi:Protein of unknown function (DUF3300)
MASLRLRMMASALPVLLATPAVAVAQQAQIPSPAEAAAALAPAPHYSRQQLDQMLAPIALYPDQVLMQVLMAATFPQQLLDANQWLQDPHNAALRGEDLYRALDPLPWDPSVKSLVAFPQLVAMLCDHLDWTEELGLAFANQQRATMARIQFLRGRALAAGRLRSTQRLRVEREGPEIVIVPAAPNLVYIPVYNPAEVYGSWPDRAYPPVYIPPPPDFYTGAIGAGIGFSVGFGVVAPLWGWGHPDWRRHEVVVDRRRYENITRVSHDTTIHNDTWHHAGPVARVPEARRPHPAATAGPHPPGTVTSAAIAAPRAAHPAGGPHAHPAEHAVAHPPAGPHPAPHPAEHAVAHPPAGPHPAPHPAEHAVAHPPAGPHPAPHPAEHAVAHPPAGPHPAPHPAQHAVAHPPAGPHPAPHPAEHVAAHPRPAAHPAPHPVAHAAVHPAPHPAAHAAAHPAPHPAAHAAAHPAPHPARHAAAPAKKAEPEKH